MKLPANAKRCDEKKKILTHTYVHRYICYMYVHTSALCACSGRCLCLSWYLCDVLLELWLPFDCCTFLFFCLFVRFNKSTGVQGFARDSSLICCCFFSRKLCFHMLLLISIEWEVPSSRCFVVLGVILYMLYIYIYIYIFGS